MFKLTVSLVLMLRKRIILFVSIKTSARILIELKNNPSVFFSSINIFLGAK